MYLECKAERGFKIEQMKKLGVEYVAVIGPWLYRMVVFELWGGLLMFQLLADRLQMSSEKIQINFGVGRCMACFHALLEGVAKRSLIFFFFFFLPMALHCN